MLDQLHNFVATAQAIQTYDPDFEAPMASKSGKDVHPVRPQRSYTFTPSGYALHPASLAIYVDGRHVTSRLLSDRQYNAFVRLANSGNYRVVVMQSEWGVAWTMSRRDA